MMCDARLFAPQIAAFSGARSVMVGYLGGQSSVEALAEAALQDAPPRFALAGLSMGGIVAMAIVARAPERVTRLALMDTNASAERDEIAARRLPQIAAVESGALRAVMRDEMKPNYLAEGPNQGAILDTCMAMADALGAEVFVRQSRALMSRPDARAGLQSVTVPTLVLCGAEDSLCPLHRHETIRDLVPGSELQVIAGAGHLPTLEQPDRTTRALAGWLAR